MSTAPPPVPEGTVTLVLIGWVDVEWSPVLTVPPLLDAAPEAVTGAGAPATGVTAGDEGSETSPGPAELVACTVNV